jgi:hypothetical protein
VNTRKKVKEGKRFLTDEDVVEVAQGLIANKYFLSTQIPKSQQRQLMHMIFLPLAFMKKRDLNTMVTNDVVCLFEETGQAMPRGINGFPMFPSCRQMTREDYKRVLETEHKLREAMNAVLVKRPEESDGRHRKPETSHRRKPGSKRRSPRPSAR